MPDPVHLHFTQDDRDLLLKLDSKMDALLEKSTGHGRRLNNHHRRLARLEAEQQRDIGTARTLRLVSRAIGVAFAALTALAGWLGLHIARGK